MNKKTLIILNAFLLLATTPTKAVEQSTPPEEKKENPAPKKEEAVERERSLNRRETLHQGFYPSNEVSQKPKDMLTERTIKPLDTSRKP